MKLKYQGNDLYTIKSLLNDLIQAVASFSYYWNNHGSQNDKRPIPSQVVSPGVPADARIDQG